MTEGSKIENQMPQNAGERFIMAFPRVFAVSLLPETVLQTLIPPKKVNSHPQNRATLREAKVGQSSTSDILEYCKVTIHLAFARVTKLNG
jgi:hypothetical protein